MKGPLIGALAVLGVLVAGGLYFMTLESSGSGGDEASLALEREVLALRSRSGDREDVDRGRAKELLVQVKAHADAETAMPLIRSRAILELLLGRFQDAWRYQERLVQALDPEVGDLRLAAEMLERLYATRGEPVHARRAIGFLRSYVDQQADGAAALLAWQCARRVGDDSAVEEFSNRLQGEFGETPSGRLSTVLAGEPSLAQLRELEIAFLRATPPFPSPLVPAELDAAIAVELMKQGDQGALLEAQERVQAVIANQPSSVDGRSLSAFVWHASGDRKRRDQALEWLLDNAPRDDQRRETWTQMKLVDVMSLESAGDGR